MGNGRKSRAGADDGDDDARRGAMKPQPPLEKLSFFKKPQPLKFTELRKKKRKVKVALLSNCIYMMLCTHAYYILRGMCAAVLLFLHIIVKICPMNQPIGNIHSI